MSAQESCLSLIKYFLFVFNLFFFALGSLIFCFGIWILIDKTSFVSFVGLSFVPLQTWSKILAISGVLTMGLALLGCVGALKELRSLLGLYFGILLLLFATQITLGILISTQRVRLERRVKELVLTTIQNYGSDPEETAAEESWDYTQFQGCAKSLQKWLHNNLISIVGICLGIGLLEVSLMVLSLQLHRPALRREPAPQVPGAAPGLSVDCGAEHCGAAAWGSRGSAGICPTWGDRVPPDQESKAETGSAEAETDEAPE
ncbi:PREDICTED: leukocyte antigen CD37 isoform X4 [Chinchilla lanigera]|uniref:leukocyte antigen CD37 isoform X4 n=1 Tax=Chinchilla lanigera TaxID=34839 RepID=UPI000695E547|nr:PREDICTED: leukocyte antigen CD37 isoform X4 [Chinchilla lanigera]